MDNFSKEYVEGELEYLDKGRGRVAVDVEPYIPTLNKKKVDDIEHYLVILVSHHKVLQANLFNNLGRAENNFVNLVCEYAGQGISKEDANKFVKYKFYRFPEGSVTINRPNINTN